MNGYLLDAQAEIDSSFGRSGVLAQTSRHDHFGVLLLTTPPQTAVCCCSLDMAAWTDGCCAAGILVQVRGQRDEHPLAPATGHTEALKMSRPYPRHGSFPLQHTANCSLAADPPRRASKTLWRTLGGVYGVLPARPTVYLGPYIPALKPRYQVNISLCPQNTLFLHPTAGATEGKYNSRFPSAS
ncbi:hypothetical protein Q7P37_007719 [Cladosporium fusiforme]